MAAFFSSIFGETKKKNKLDLDHEGWKNRPLEHFSKRWRESAVDLEEIMVKQTDAFLKSFCAGTPNFKDQKDYLTQEIITTFERIILPIAQVQASTAAEFALLIERWLSMRKNANLRFNMTSCAPLNAPKLNPDSTTHQTSADQQPAPLFNVQYLLNVCFGTIRFSEKTQENSLKRAQERLMAVLLQAAESNALEERSLMLDYTLKCLNTKQRILAMRFFVVWTVRQQETARDNDTTRKRFFRPDEISAEVFVDLLHCVVQEYESFSNGGTHSPAAPFGSFSQRVLVPFCKQLTLTDWLECYSGGKPYLANKIVVPKQFQPLFAKVVKASESHGRKLTRADAISYETQLREVSRAGAHHDNVHDDCCVLLLCKIVDSTYTFDSSALRQMEHDEQVVISFKTAMLQAFEERELPKAFLTAPLKYDDSTLLEKIADVQGKFFAGFVPFLEAGSELQSQCLSTLGKGPFFKHLKEKAIISSTDFTGLELSKSTQLGETSHLMQKTLKKIQQYVAQQLGDHMKANAACDFVAETGIGGFAEVEKVLHLRGLKESVAKLAQHNERLSCDAKRIVLSGADEVAKWIDAAERLDSTSRPTTVHDVNQLSQARPEACFIEFLLVVGHKSSKGLRAFFSEVSISELQHLPDILRKQQAELAHQARVMASLLPFATEIVITGDWTRLKDLWSACRGVTLETVSAWKSTVEHVDELRRARDKLSHRNDFGEYASLLAQMPSAKFTFVLPLRDVQTLQDSESGTSVASTSKQDAALLDMFLRSNACKVVLETMTTNVCLPLRHLRKYAQAFSIMPLSQQEQIDLRRTGHTISEFIQLQKQAEQLLTLLARLLSENRSDSVLSQLAQWSVSNFKFDHRSNTLTGDIHGERLSEALDRLRKAEGSCSNAIRRSRSKYPILANFTNIEIMLLWDLFRARVHLKEKWHNALCLLAVRSGRCLDECNQWAEDCQQELIQELPQVAARIAKFAQGEQQLPGIQQPPVRQMKLRVELIEISEVVDWTAHVMHHFHQRIGRPPLTNELVVESMPFFEEELEALLGRLRKKREDHVDAGAPAPSPHVVVFLSIEAVTPQVQSLLHAARHERNLTIFAPQDSIRLAQALSRSISRESSPSTPTIGDFPLQTAKVAMEGCTKAVKDLSGFLVCSPRCRAGATKAIQKELGVATVDRFKRSLTLSCATSASALRQKILNLDNVGGLHIELDIVHTALLRWLTFSLLVFRALVTGKGEACTLTSGPLFFEVASLPSAASLIECLPQKPLSYFAGLVSVPVSLKHFPTISPGTLAKCAQIDSEHFATPRTQHIRDMFLKFCARKHLWSELLPLALLTAHALGRGDTLPLLSEDNWKTFSSDPSADALGADAPSILLTFDSEDRPVLIDNDPTSSNGLIESLRPHFTPENVIVIRELPLEKRAAALQLCLGATPDAGSDLLRGYVVVPATLVAATMIRLSVDAGIGPTVFVGQTGCGKTFAMQVISKVCDWELVTEEIDPSFQARRMQRKLNTALTKAASSKPRRIVVFLDEFNTTVHTSDIKQITSDRCWPGMTEEVRQLMSTDAVQFVLAANPLCYHDGFKVYAVQSQIHRTLETGAWTFQSHAEEDESSIVQIMAQKGNLPNSVVQYLSDLVPRIHAFLRQHAPTLPLSFRDFDRVVRLSSTTSTDDAAGSKSCSLVHFLKQFLCFDPTSIDILASNVAVAMTYYMGLGDTLRSLFADAFPEVVAAYIKTLEAVSTSLLDSSTSVEDKLLRRTFVLKEALFVVLCGFVTQTPLLLLGPSGTSKSLAPNALQRLLSEAKIKPFDQLPTIMQLTFQCSSATTVESIESLFADAYAFDKLQAGRTRSLIMMDELGVTPQSSLKVLNHRLSTEGNQPAFIGTSNYALDRSQMNRLACLRRDKVSRDDLDTIFNQIPYADAIRDTFLRPLSNALLANNLGMDLAHKKDCQPQDLVRVIGLRDVYAFCREMSTIPDGNTQSKIVLAERLARHLGPSALELMGWEHEYDDEKREIWRQKAYISHLISTSGLLDGHRPLLVTSATEFSCHHAALSFGEYFKLRPVFLVGCVLRFDPNCLSDQLRRVMLAMESGRPLVILNDRSVHASLLDAYNMQYTQQGPARFVRIALNNDSDYCRVADGFQIVVVQIDASCESGDAESLPAFYHRLEKNTDNLFDRVVTAGDVASLPFDGALAPLHAVFSKNRNPDRLRRLVFGYHNYLINEKRLTEKEQALQYVRLLRPNALAAALRKTNPREAQLLMEEVERIQHPQTSLQCGKRCCVITHIAKTKQADVLRRFKLERYPFVRLQTHMLDGAARSALLDAEAKLKAVATGQKRLVVWCTFNSPGRSNVLNYHLFALCELIDQILVGTTEVSLIADVTHPERFSSFSGEACSSAFEIQLHESWVTSYYDCDFAADADEEGAERPRAITQLTLDMVSEWPDAQVREVATKLLADPSCYNYVRNDGHDELVQRCTARLLQGVSPRSWQDYLGARDILKNAIRLYYGLCALNRLNMVHVFDAQPLFDWRRLIKYIHTLHPSSRRCFSPFYPMPTPGNANRGIPFGFDFCIANPTQECLMLRKEKLFVKGSDGVEQERALTVLTLSMAQWKDALDNHDACAPYHCSRPTILAFLKALHGVLPPEGNILTLRAKSFLALGAAHRRLDRFEAWTTSSQRFLRALHPICPEWASVFAFFFPWILESETEPDKKFTSTAQLLTETGSALRDNEFNALSTQLLTAAISLRQEDPTATEKIVKFTIRFFAVRFAQDPVAMNVAAGDQGEVFAWHDFATACANPSLEVSLLASLPIFDEIIKRCDEALPFTDSVYRRLHTYIANVVYVSQMLYGDPGSRGGLPRDLVNVLRICDLPIFLQALVEPDDDPERSLTVFLQEKTKTLRDALFAYNQLVKVLFRESVSPHIDKMAALNLCCIPTPNNTAKITEMKSDWRVLLPSDVRRELFLVSRLSGTPAVIKDIFAYAAASLLRGISLLDVSILDSFLAVPPCPDFHVLPPAHTLDIFDPASPILVSASKLSRIRLIDEARTRLAGLAEPYFHAPLPATVALNSLNFEASLGVLFPLVPRLLRHAQRAVHGADRKSDAELQKICEVSLLQLIQEIAPQQHARVCGTVDPSLQLCHLHDLLDRLFLFAEKEQQQRAAEEEDAAADWM